MISFIILIQVLKMPCVNMFIITKTRLKFWIKPKSLSNMLMTLATLCQYIHPQSDTSYKYTVARDNYSAVAPSGFEKSVKLYSKQGVLPGWRKWCPSGASQFSLLVFFKSEGNELKSHYFLTAIMSVKNMPTRFSHQDLHRDKMVAFGVPYIDFSQQDSTSFPRNALNPSYLSESNWKRRQGQRNKALTSLHAVCQDFFGKTAPLKNFRGYCFPAGQLMWCQVFWERTRPNAHREQSEVISCCCVFLFSFFFFLAFLTAHLASSTLVVCCWN